MLICKSTQFIVQRATITIQFAVLCRIVFIAIFVSSVQQKRVKESWRGDTFTHQQKGMVHRLNMPGAPFYALHILLGQLGRYMMVLRNQPTVKRK
ncbi:MAG TPA: hypothetical protein DEQ06_01945 [Porphyromonadaceae bacterium]|nr:hypothetical protein [Porphyromonadaceae bacterium]